MPALAGEPWRGLGKTQVVDNVTGNGRFATVSITDVNPVTASGDQADWDYANDTIALTLRAEWAGGGAAAPPAIQTFEVMVRIPGGAQVGSTWSFTPAGDTGVQTRTIHFDTDPLDQALAAAALRRWGTLELYVRIQNGDALGYNADSRGVISTPGAGRTHSWGRGYIRQRAFLSTYSISNASLGGAEPSIWAFPDSIFTRVNTLRQAYESLTLTHSLRRTGAGSVERTQGVAGAGSQYDYSWTAAAGGNTSRVGEGVQATEETKDADLALTAADFGGDNKFVWASTGHLSGWSQQTDLLIRDPDRINVDPRITATHHFQTDDNVFGLAKDVTPRQMRVDQSGFLYTRFTNSRDEGSNLITATMSLDPQAPGSTIIQSSATSTQDGEDGWTSSPLEWVVVKPGGLWDKSVDVTSPSDIDNDSYLVGGDETGYSLLVENPNVRIGIRVSSIDSEAADHLKEGDTMSIEVFLIDTLLKKNVESDEAPTLVINRATGNNVNSKAQHWDFVTEDWADSGGAVKTPDGFVSMLQSSTDSRVWYYELELNSNFGASDFIVVVSALNDGFPYTGMVLIELVGTFNQHDKNNFDPIGLFK